MYQRILIAFDGSHTSELALQEAIALARALGSTIRLVHAVDIASGAWFTDEFTNSVPIWDYMVKTGRELLDRASSAVAAAGVTFDTRLVEINSVGQRVANVIIEQAEAWPADLIVLGTHGRRGLNKILLGSVAEGVMRLADKPVLMIRG